VQLRQDYQQFVDRGAAILAIGPDSNDEFRKYWTQESIPFIGLPDPKHQVANLYAQEVNLLKLGRMPALFVIDREGLIRYHHYGHSMSDIPSNASVLALLDQIIQEQ
jgi:peroxiredoxin